MKLLTVITALSAARALASPVLDTRNLPDGVDAHQHGHIDFHLGRKLRARHDIDARALAGGAPSDQGTGGPTSPIENDETKTPVANHDETSPVMPSVHDDEKKPPVTNEDTEHPVNDKDDDNDTPAEDFIDELDKLYGDSVGTGPSDDWRDQWEDQAQPQMPPAASHPQAPSSPSPPPPPAPPAAPASPVRPKKEIVVFETEIVVVTQVVQPDQKNVVTTSSSPQSTTLPPPIADAKPEADAHTNEKPATPPPDLPKETKPKEEEKPKQQPNANAVEQPKPQPQPQPQVEHKAQPPPQPKTQPKPQEQAKPPPQPKTQPKPQEQAKPQPQEQAKPQPQKQPDQPKTQEKPQPTQKEPSGSPSSGSHVNTDGLPMDFIDNLDCHSDVFKGLAKLHHDIHRTNHSLPVLAWNDTLFEYAKETAETCVYGHSLAAGGGGYGQNIASGDAPGNISAVLTNAYYNLEIELFYQAIGEQWGRDDPDMSEFEKWGHATQMLWKSTTSFACYVATCSPPGADPLDCAPDGSSYLKNVACGDGGTKAYNTVCNYYPPGNYAGEYSAVPGPEGIMGFVEMTHNGVIGL